MTFAFEEHVEAPHWQSVLDLCRFLHQDAIERDLAGGSPTVQIVALKRAGLLAVHLPKTFGGLDLSWENILRDVREFAKTDGSVAHLYGYHYLQLATILIKGTEAQKSSLLARTRDEELFWANSGNVAARSSIGRRVEGGFIVSGSRPFSSGSHVADDLIVGFETTDGALVQAAIPATREGIVVEGDWDGIGQRQTGSGTVTYNDVLVHDEEMLGQNRTPDDVHAFSLISLLSLAVVMNVFAGSAIGALEEARRYTKEKSRPFLHSGLEKSTDDPWIQRDYGDLVIRAVAALQQVREANATLDIVWRKSLALSGEERGRLAIAIAAANVSAGETALHVCSKILEPTGARSAVRQTGLDRFWRNVRTHSLHNPAEYKRRTVGTWFLTGAYPGYGPFR
ncbi:MAG: acyl-CoA dehydrogenase family protein [Rhizobium sp.]